MICPLVKIFFLAQIPLLPAQSCTMRPDYPSKFFNDKRSRFILLMQTLAAETLL